MLAPKAPPSQPPSHRRPRPQPVRERSQEWLNRRLAGLSLSDFKPKGVMFYSAEGLNPPAGFVHGWRSLANCDDIMLQAIAQTGAKGSSPAIILVDPADANHAHIVASFLSHLQESCDTFPVTILVPHSVGPGLPDSVRCQVFSMLLDTGFDDCIIGEPEGIRLAVAVQARLISQAKHSQNLKKAQSQYDLDAQCIMMRRCIDEMLWTYGRVRLGTFIPEVDHNISPGEPVQLENFQLGIVLGKGAFGKVFKIRDVQDLDPHPVQVIKSFAKVAVNMHGLKAIKDEIVAMKLLSSGQWGHRNITQLYAIYHSPTHIFLRMEYSGPETLYRRLSKRDSQGKSNRPLSLEKVGSIISQCIAALHRLHVGPMVAHRDIKPANIIISETSEEVVVKLSDFGLAKIADKSDRCRGHCGTLPYMAPETVLDYEYSVFPADVWSMGIVFLEIFCFVEIIVQKVFKRSTEDRKNKKSKVDLMERLRSYFEKEGIGHGFLENHLRTELQSLAPVAAELIDGMLDVMPSQRWSVQEIVERSKLRAPIA